MARTRKASEKKADAEAAKAAKARKDVKPTPKQVQNPEQHSISKGRGKKSAKGHYESPQPTSRPASPPTTVPSGEHTNVVDADPATAILILLGKEYELQTFVYLDKERVSSSHEFRKLNAFNFQLFHAESIKTTAKRNQCKEDSIQWSRGEAEAVYHGLPKQANAFSDVYDDDDWKKVETTIKEWIMDHKTGIRVVLSLFLKKNVEVQGLMPRTPAIASDGVHVTSRDSKGSKVILFST
jgi:hypothetical protein